jgi:ribosome-associated translation inhibitor RaiA
MKLNIRSNSVDLSDEIRALIKLRVYFALSRFGPRISSTSVRIEDIHNDSKGIDQRCLIAIKVDRGDELIVEAVDTNVRAAISVASDRARKTVQRHLDRKHSE